MEEEWLNSAKLKFKMIVGPEQWDKIKDSIEGLDKDELSYIMNQELKKRINTLLEMHENEDQKITE